MNEKNKKEKIRESAHLPNTNGDILGLVCEDSYEVCENTMQISRISEAKKAEYGISSTKCDDGTPFDCGPSGGAISPYTEVNADHQGIISEVPRKPEFYPDTENNKK
ncbi:MAG: hypothetical protein IJ437_02375 [Clostridia bacterium]|nr:hypothetical protein [Clostridia bacterium]